MRGGTGGLQPVQLLEAIQRAQAQYITERDPAVVFRGLLGILIELTDSGCGFLNEIVEDEGGPYMVSRALSDISWDEESRRLYQQIVARNEPLRDFQTLNGRAAATGEIVIANDPTHDSRARGLPTGHPPLSSFMGLPVRLGEQLVGVAGVANRADGYDEHLAVALGPFLNTCAAIIHDVRRDERQQRAEVERQQLQAQLLRAQKLESLGVLAGGVAHDFNNLLTAILGNASLVLEDLPPESPMRSWVAEIVGAANKAANLCRQMAACSGRRPLLLRPVDLSGLVQDMARTLRRSIARNATLRLEVPGGLPTVKADGGQLRQALLNLVVNAAEALRDRQGVVTVRTGVIDAATLGPDCLGGMPPSGRVVLLEVKDNGCGMDRTLLSRVFEPFFTTKFTGRGIGLSAVLGIVRGHCGNLWVESAPGCGSTFLVALPASDAAASLARPAAQAPAAAAWRGTGIVLVVDDDEGALRTTTRMVEHLGFTALAASGGLEALALYREQSAEITCVLLDAAMPGMDGEETLCELRRIRADARVVLCTGFDVEQLRPRFAELGAAGFVQKPYSPEALAQELRRVLALTT